MPPLLDFALSMSRPVPEPVIVRESQPGPRRGGTCEFCGGRTYKGRATCTKCESQARRKPQRSPEELSLHKAGDHSLCSPDRAGHGVCSQCGKTVQVARSSAPPERRRCQVCRGFTLGSDGRSEVLTLTCANVECGRQFTRRARQVVNDHPCCSRSCSMKAAIRRGERPGSLPQIPGVSREERRRARCRQRYLRHAQTWDGITDKEILARDGWRCQIPGCKRRPIRKDAEWPHPRSKSIDHIVPLSLGGDDVAANKRAAHLGCNVARGNRMAEEQLPLFGSVSEAPLATETVGERAVLFEKQKRFCGCGAEPLEGRKFCQCCLDRLAAEAEDRRALRVTCPVHYYVCRYCGDLKSGRRTVQPREVCPARACQLARLAANNLRLRNGLTAAEADAQMAAVVRAGTYDFGRWQRGAAA